MSSNASHSRRDRIPSKVAHHRTNGRQLKAVAALFCLALAACGPGTGGSGSPVGPNATFGAFGATASNVCAGSLAPSLNCPIGATGAPTSEGTQMVLYSDTLAGNNVAVSLKGNQVALDARCLGLRFEGEWGITAATDARFFGTYTAAGAPPALATLTVQTAGGAAGAPQPDLVALLRDAGGRLLLGPVLLQRVAAPVTTPAACPP